MTEVCVIDNGHANLTSVCRAVEAAAEGQNVRVFSSIAPSDLRRADKIVFPGQGAFRDCMAGLGEENAVLLRERLASGTPYFGICLGLQALFESSEEAPGVVGLGFFKGTNVRLRDEPGVKIPHMGWNELELRNGGHSFLHSAGGEHTWVYFVHSFHAAPLEPTVTVATVQHGTQTVTAAVARENVFATQFHPEKSQGAGIDILRAFHRA